jgi:hypothetical protein
MLSTRRAIRQTYLIPPRTHARTHARTRTHTHTHIHTYVSDRRHSVLWKPHTCAVVSTLSRHVDAVHYLAEFPGLQRA